MTSDEGRAWPCGLMFLSRGFAASSKIDASKARWRPLTKRRRKSVRAARGTKQSPKTTCDASPLPKRRGQDSNLRTGYPVTGLANPRFRPLSHLSELGETPARPERTPSPMEPNSRQFGRYRKAVIALVERPNRVDRSIRRGTTANCRLSRPAVPDAVRLEAMIFGDYSGTRSCSRQAWFFRQGVRCAAVRLRSVWAIRVTATLMACTAIATAGFAIAGGH